MKNRKILINTDFGGFGLSDKAIELYLNKKGLKFAIEKKNSLFSKRSLIFYVNGVYFSDHEVQRDDPALIKAVEEIGMEESADSFSTLKIVKVPCDVDWELKDYDGSEWIAEKHRTWQWARQQSLFANAAITNSTQALKSVAKTLMLATSAKTVSFS